jgi:hypothetical protein
MFYYNNFAYSDPDYDFDNNWKTQANCLGYALGVKRWVRVVDFDKVPNKILANRFRKAFDLKPIHKNDMALGKEYLAMRFAGKDDYHFIWRGKKGHWRHKMAGTRVESISQREVFYVSWGEWLTKYRGTIYLYEYERDKINQFLNVEVDSCVYEEILYDLTDYDVLR